MDPSSTEVQKSMRKKQHAKRKVFTDSHSVKESATYEAGKILIVTCNFCYLVLVNLLFCILMVM